MTDEQLIALARKHGATQPLTTPNVLMLDASVLRSLLQAVADASYERAAGTCDKAQEEWGDRTGDYGTQAYLSAKEIRNLKGTLPEMEG